MCTENIAAVAENVREELSASIHRRSLHLNILETSLIGQFSLEIVQGVAVTVIGDCYRAMLNEFFFSQF